MSQRDKKLEGKVALVTGGNSGIGLTSAQLIAQHGAKVIITARSAETFSKAKKEHGAVFDVVQCDVSDLGDLDKLFKFIETKHKKLDIVFANAGFGEFMPTQQMTSEAYDRMMNTNAKGAYFTVTKALPLLNDGSSVILNSSVGAAKGVSGASVYAATKAALRSFVRTWTAEIPPSKIRFNVVSPGYVKTPAFGKLGLTPEQVSGFESFLIGASPSKRAGTTDEIASVVVFLASSDSSYICGADIVADGGFAQV